MLGFRRVRYGIQAPNWIDSEYYNKDPMTQYLLRIEKSFCNDNFRIHFLLFFSHFRPHNDAAIVIALMGSINSRMGVSSLTLTVLRKKELRDSSLPTMRRDREGRGHILVLKIKVPARFKQLLRDGSIPNQLLRDGSFCKNTWL